MTPASARGLRRARVAELRQAEPGLSLRQMAQRLGLSRDTVRRDLADLDEQAAQSATPVDESAPGGAGGPAGVAHLASQVSEGGAGGASQDRPPARLPVRVAQPLSGIDLSQWPALRRDLAQLAQTGRSPEALVHQAVVALAHNYGKALADGLIEVGQPFHVLAMTLAPLPRPAARSTQAELPAAGA